MRLALLVCSLMAASLLAPGGARASEPFAPTPVVLAHGWQFAPDPGDRGLTDGLQRGDRGTRWVPVTLPHVFDPRPLPSLFGGTVGWYRLRFRPPSLPPEFSWAMRFEQVRRVAQVWVNGNAVGSHLDPYTPFELPLTGLRPGQVNTVVVRVDNRKGVEPREGWWNWGGITRPVSLVAQGAVVLRDIGVLGQLSCAAGGACGPAAVTVDGWLSNRAVRPLTARVAVTLRPPGGGPAITGEASTAPLAPGERAPLRLRIPIPAPARLWAPDHPHLYAADVRTTAAGRPAQEDTLQVGVRSVQVRGGRLMLNGRAVNLRGTAIQEDMPGHGPALTDSDMDTIVAELKAVHANVTRAHYLLNPGLLDRLDRAGIMVWSQAPIYHRDELLKTAAERSSALATLRATVLAARIHPAVLTHSVANELSPEPDRLPSTRAYLDAAAQTARALDPTVPVSVDLLSYPGYPRQRTYDDFDLLGINNYFGWYPGKSDHSTARLADLAPYLLRMHSLYPRQGMVMTEFGAEATVDGPASVKQTFAFQTDYVRRTLEAVGGLPFVGGAIYWTLREFAVKPHWDGGAHRHDVRHDSIHHKGLISYGGAPKPAWLTAERLFAATALYPPSATAVGDRRPTAGPSDIVALLGVLLGLAFLVAVSVWSYLGIRAAGRDKLATTVSGWRLGQADAGPPDTTYA